MARHLIQNAATGETRIVGDAALPFFPGFAVVDTYDDGIPPAVFYGAGEADLRYVNVTELSDPTSAASVALRAASVAAVQDAIEDGVIEVGGPGGGGDTTVTYDGDPVAELEIVDATAADVPVTPTGSLSATNVQAAFAELVGDLTLALDRIVALEGGTVATFQLLTESGNTLTTEAGDVLVLA